MARKECFYCLKWNVTDESEEEVKRQLKAHLSSPQHRVNFLKHFYSKNKSELLRNKKDVELGCLEVLIDKFQVSGVAKPRSSCTFTLTIENRSDETVYLNRCEFLHRLACRWEVTDEYMVSSGKRTLEIPANEEYLSGRRDSPDPYYVKVEVMPDHVGIYQSPLMFQFVRKGEPPFFIGLEIVVHCSDDIVQTLQSSQPYTGKKEYDVRRPAADIRPGVKPKQQKVMEYVIGLKSQQIDPELRSAYEELQEMFKTWVHLSEDARDDMRLSAKARCIYNFLLENFKPDHYAQYFNILLNLEEVQMDHDIRKYDMENAVLHQNSKKLGLLSLKVLGLAEKRPSVLKGDRLFVRIAKETKDVEYEGIVHAIEEMHVFLGFGKDLMKKYLPNMRFHVRFSYSKYPMNVMLRGLTMVQTEHISYWLFPDSKSSAKCSPVINPTEKLVFYNRNIEENPEQRTAIQHIVAGSSLPAPYLLHGPPGTGKTVTLVEAVLQLWKVYNTRTYKAYILVCTPSNSASDLVAERLLKHLPRTDILRFYSLSRDLKQVPTEIKDKKCLNYDFQKQMFIIPTLKDIMSYRVVVSTLCNSARLVSLGIGVGHFTHIFLDECGHAVEPEALSPLVGLLKCRQEGDNDFGGQIVLAGDPMQLGPIIRCRVAQEFHLTRSLLERLMEMPIYSKIKNENDSTGKFDPKLLTRLRNNYRSHPAILHEPNRLFYDGELRVCADKLKREALCHWEGLPITGFPVLFHGVLGRDMQEAKNPSYFNPQEVSLVVHYVDWLLSSRTMGINIQPKEIGVISPYRQQVYKIKNELQRKQARGNITVGSVDEFQGQERRVIIISTVRSDPDLMTYDRKYKLGFLDNPKRFNVALTRAQCLLIIIGNPNLLSKDCHWNAFLRYCRDNGSYVGANYDDPDDEVSDVLQRFNALHLLPVEKEPVKISHRANQEDPEWRNEE